jgi:hypothetical protein
MWPKRFNIAVWIDVWNYEEQTVVTALKVFLWWFLVGATMALAVIMLQGGMREVMQAQGSVWELKLMELVTTIVGGGLLGGCVALILDRIKKS